MRTKPFCTRASCNVVCVCFGVESFMCVVLQGSGDELGSISERWLVEIVFVLQHGIAVREVTKDFFDQLLLLLSRRISFEGVIDFLHAFTGCNIFCIAADALPCGWL